MSTLLAEQQAALMAALAGKAPVPAGFDAARVQAAAAALAFKRARAVAQTWPSTRAALGDRFRELFADYAIRTPLAQDGGPLADGRRFVQDLSRHTRLTDATLMQALSFDTRYRFTAQGAARRRWPALRCAWLWQSRTLAVAFGERIYRFSPLPGLR
jgi:hypothetical protein